MFEFTVAEKEHCHLENEPRGRAGMMGGNTGWITEGKKGSGELVKGPGVTCTKSSAKERPWRALLCY